MKLPILKGSCLKMLASGSSLLLLLASAPFPASAALGDVPSTGLMGHWGLEEGTGTSAADASGNNRPISLVNGVTWTAGSVGNSSVVLDGVNDYIEATSSLNSPTFPVNGTLSFWVKGVFGTTTNRSLFDRFDGTRNHVFIRTYVPANGVQIAFHQSDAGYAFNSDTRFSIATSTWTHVAVVWNTTTDFGYVYKDGALLYSASIASSTWTPSAQVFRFGASSNTFGGGLDDIALYNRALSSDEIAYIYSGVGPVPPPAPDCTSFVAAGDSTYSSMNDVQCALNAATPGTTVKVASGTYDSAALIVASNGSAGDPVTLMPASPEGVIFTGDTNITLNGSYLALSGFRFENTGTAFVSSTSTGSTELPMVSIDGDHVRVTGNTFLNAAGGDSVHNRIVRVKNTADDAEVDANTFTGSKTVSIGVLNAGTALGEAPERTHIHGNTFQNIYIPAANGGETIQIGTGPYSDRDTDTLIEDNYLNNVIADPEFFSLKTSGSTVRNNVIVDTFGGLSLRFGTGNVVSGNLIVRSSRGIVVVGSGHTITNNIVTGASGSALRLRYGQMDPPGDTSNDGSSGDHPAANDNLIANNTFVSNRDNILIENFSPTAATLSDPTLIDPILGNTIVNNIFQFATSTQAVISIDERYQSLSNFIDTNELSHNIFWNASTTLSAVPALATEPDLNYFVDPRIVLNGDSAPGLADDSPAIASGLSGYVTTDYSGSARYDVPDIGAIETVRVDTPTTTPEESSSGRHSSGGSKRPASPGATSVTGTSVLIDLVLANRALFLSAQAQGIVLPSFVLETLGISSPSSFLRDLTMGSEGADVRMLQMLLITKGYVISAGATGYFGVQTRDALAAYQTASGISPAAGYFGPKTRAAFR